MRRSGVLDAAGRLASEFDGVFRPMLGPIEDMRRSGVLDAAGRLASELGGVSNLAEELQKRYRLPALAETVGFLQSSEKLGIWKTLDWSPELPATLQRAASPPDRSLARHGRSLAFCIPASANCRGSDIKLWPVDCLRPQRCRPAPARSRRLARSYWTGPTRSSPIPWHARTSTGHADWILP